jgi:hypothetical protein
MYFSLALSLSASIALVTSQSFGQFSATTQCLLFGFVLGAVAVVSIKEYVHKNKNKEVVK